jgi:hypothetical protein
VSDKTAITLGICAAAGLTFYGALAVTLTEEVDLTEAAAEASATGVGAAAAIVAETAGTIWNIQNIVKVSAALGALLASQAAALATLHGDAIDTSAYPGGHWPKSANL